MMALVEQPIAIATVMAFSKFSRVWILRRQVFPHHLDDAAAAFGPCGWWLASAAGIDEAPGSVMPMASAIAVMVLAVPMVMQVP
jgi:hypothetical protein